MRSFLLIIIAIVCNNLIIAQARLEWHSSISFDTINFPGTKNIFIQKCTNDIDSFIVTGTLIFKKAKFNKLGICEYTQFVKDTVITKVELQTRGKDGYKNLLIYLDIFNADNKINTSNLNSIYINTSFMEYKSRIIYLILITDKKNSKNKLIMEWIN